jgi:hypothetical protein
LDAEFSNGLDLKAAESSSIKLSLLKFVYEKKFKSTDFLCSSNIARAVPPAR